MKRIRGIRANSSRLSHAELDNAPELDIGDPLELGGQYAELLRRFPLINVLGGCCGTDHRPVDCISTACRRAALSDYQLEWIFSGPLAMKARGPFPARSGGDGGIRTLDTAFDRITV